MSFEIALADENREIISFSNGQAAMDYLEHEHCDLVLLDFNMPKMTGLDVLRNIRAQGNLAHVVVCSAHITDRALINSVKHGVVDFIAKPLSLTNLRKYVNHLLGEKERENTTLLNKALWNARMMDFESAYHLLEKESSPSPKAKLWHDFFGLIAKRDMEGENKSKLERLASELNGYLKQANS